MRTDWKDVLAIGVALVVYSVAMVVGLVPAMFGWITHRNV